MSTVVYYLFCEACGGDTAAYDLVTVCPYCHTKKRMRVISNSQEETNASSIQAQLEAVRANWMSQKRRWKRASKSKRGLR
ncbi:hypothetical protein ALPO108162_05680 [Alicyclobacillus pomorum]